MKKTIATLIAVLMSCSMCAVVSAATLTETGSANGDVKATYQEGSSGGTIYSVDLSWGAMEFTFTDVSEGTWNPETHQYVNSAASKWEANGNTVTATNHSNTSIDVSFAYNKESGYDSVNGTLDVNSKSLATAVGTTVDAAPSVTSTLTLSGSLDSDTPAKTKVGTVVVTIR